MISAVDPQRLATGERLDEIGHILAAGILRARAKRLESQGKSMGGERDSSLDFSGEQRRHVRIETRCGDKR